MKRFEGLLGSSCYESLVIWSGEWGWKGHGWGYLWSDKAEIASRSTKVRKKTGYSQCHSEWRPIQPFLPYGLAIPCPFDLFRCIWRLGLAKLLDFGATWLGHAWVLIPAPHPLVIWRWSSYTKRWPRCRNTVHQWLNRLKWYYWGKWEDMCRFWVETHLECGTGNSRSRWNFVPLNFWFTRSVLVPWYVLGSCLTSNGEGMGIERSHGQEKVEPMLTLDCAPHISMGIIIFRYLVEQPPTQRGEIRCCWSSSLWLWNNME